jgi:predicted DNA-binding ribbon-helix-helix protein
VKKRSIRIDGHPTSVTLEEPFWEALKELSDRQDKSVSQLVAEIDAQRGDENLSSALRVYILNYVRTKSSD